jgi:essential nuclear protein 1
MPRSGKPVGKSRHDPLLVQLDEDDAESRYGRISQPGKRQKAKPRRANDGDGSGEVNSLPQPTGHTIEA